MSHTIKSIIKYFLDFPKTLWFNFKVFPFLIALRLPVLVDRRTSIKCFYKGCVKIDAPFKTYMIKLGVGKDGVAVDRKGNYIDIQKNAQLIFHGNAIIRRGCSLHLGANATVEFGNNFFANNSFLLMCEKSVIFDDDVLIGWNVCVRDADGHNIFSDGMVCNQPEKIIIGHHTWICSDVSVLKGSVISENSVAAQGCIVTKAFKQQGCILGGVPAKIIKENITWKA